MRDNRMRDWVCGVLGMPFVCLISLAFKLDEAVDRHRVDMCDSNHSLVHHSLVLLSYFVSVWNWM